MNSSQSRHDTAIDEQAAHWAARLDGGVLEAVDRAGLDAWLAKSPEHRAVLSQYCQFSADLEEQLPALVATGTVKMPPENKPARKFWGFPRVMLITLAAAAAVALAFRFMLPAPLVQNFSTSVLERATYTLADGTTVELNANTSLRFENTKTERRVRLAGGEALFMVSKNRERPFTVQTPAGSVRVTGTTFNVRSDPAALDVTVIEGSVQVRAGEIAGTDAAAPFSLGAGDQLSARAGGVFVATLSANALEDALAWRDGQIVFNDVPLRAAVARFAQYHGRAINVSDTIANEKVGGRYSLDDLPGFLEALEVAIPAKATTDTSGTISLR